MNPLVRIDALALAGVNAMLAELPDGGRMILLVESGPCECHGSRALACGITKEPIVPGCGEGAAEGRQRITQSMRPRCLTILVVAYIQKGKLTL